MDWNCSFVLWSVNKVNIFRGNLENLDDFPLSWKNKIRQFNSNPHFYSILLIFKTFTLSLSVFITKIFNLDILQNVYNIDNSLGSLVNGTGEYLQTPLGLFGKIIIVLLKSEIIINTMLHAHLYIKKIYSLLTIFGA